MKKISLRILLVSFSLLILSACSQVEEVTDKIEDILPKEDVEAGANKLFADSIVSKIDAKWFQKPKRFILEPDDEMPLRHFFYDVNPDISIERQTLNYVVTSPEGSRYAYEIDLLSGQHYTNHIYCKQSDAWDLFEGKIDTPPYTVGIVPRVFDQLGTPQKIMVFGNKKYIKKHFRTNYFNTKIIGGYIEQECSKGACLERKQWESRLVLVGVNKGDKEFAEVKNIDQLKEKVDWDKVKVFAENGFGNNVVGNRFYPAYKMGANIDASTAMRFMKKNSIFFTVSKLTKMRNSCYKLYDKLWKELGSDSEVEKKLRKAKTVAQRREIIASAKKDPNAFFFKRFFRNFKLFERNFKTCSKYIYYGNVHDDPKRFWFFTYLKLFSLAHEEGYTYNCKRDTWMRNPNVTGNQRAIPLSKEFSSCTARKLDRAFAAATTLFDTMRRNRVHTYRFVDYDRGGRGTHNKLYSWVPVKNKRYNCSAGKEYYVTRPTFPADKRWKNRSINRKVKRTKK